MLNSLIVTIIAASLGAPPSVTPAASFSTGIEFPGRVAATAAGGAYVTDQVNGTVVEYDAAGTVLNTFAVPEGPVGIAVHPTLGILVSRLDGEVSIYDASFVYQGALDPTPLTLTGPNGIAVHAGSGEIYVADSNENHIMVFDAAGTLARMWGSEGGGLGELEAPQDVAIDAALDHVIVADADNFRIQVFDTAGMLQFRFGYRIAYVGMDSTTWVARATGLAVDACSNIYVTDALMGTVRVFDPAGTDYDLANPPVTYGAGAGQLRVPCGMAINAGGELFVVSSNNAAVEVFDVVCSTARAAGPRAESPRVKDDSRRISKGDLSLEAVRPTPLPEPTRPPTNNPDNPFEVVEAYQMGTYCEELDLDFDGQINMTDVEMAVVRFGAGTSDDFMGSSAGPGGGGAGPRDDGHPFDQPPHMHTHATGPEYAFICSRCHMNDGLPEGGMLTTAGQENMCLSCHTSSGTARGLVIAGAGQGNSHAWGIAATSGGVAGPAAGAFSEMEFHLDGGNIRCGTCHEPHDQTRGTPYLRASHDDGSLCKECHREAGAPQDHAVGLAHGPEYCTDCHDIHAMGDQAHLVKARLYSWYNHTTVDVGFTDDTIAVGTGGFVDPATGEYGLCDVCHEYYDDSVVPPVVSSSFLALTPTHDESMALCTTCHLHGNGFMPGLDVDPTPAYIGSPTCGACHSEELDVFMRNGHSYKLNEIQGGQVPTYPFSSIAGALANINDDDTDPADPHAGTDNSLGTPADYNDISFVIGGFGWKSRWIDADGFIVTGSEVQYNLETLGFVAYHDNEVDKKYNCGNCHTTGWKRYTSEPGDTRNLNRQNNLPGMDGTFAAPGVHCEACHGWGAAHAAAPSTANITRVATPRDTADFLADDMAFGKAVACSDCHTRDGEKDYPTYVGGPARIAAKGGLIKHHEQYDEMIGVNPDDDPAFARTGPHRDLLCTACHDPHTTTKYMAISGDDPGMNKHCTECHNPTGVGAKDYSLAGGLFDDMAGLDCIDCHMPKLAKSAVAHAAVGTGPITGDIRSHIFRIADLNTDPDQFNAAGTFAYPWITADYACKTCHNGVDAFDQTFPVSSVIHGP